MDAPQSWNTITHDQLQRLFPGRQGRAHPRFRSSPQSLPSPYPDFPLDSALRYMNDYPLIPIVNRANSHQLEGVISRDSVFQKYGTRSNRN